MIASAAWLTELILESFGCYFFFRRRVWPLWIWLGFRALADLTEMAAYRFLGFRAFFQVDYWQRQGQYLLLALVAVWTVGAVLREHKRTRNAYLGLLGAIALYAVVSFHLFSPSAVQVLKFEIWAEMVLAGFVCGAMGVASCGRADMPGMLSSFTPQSPLFFRGLRRNCTGSPSSIKQAYHGAPQPWGLISCGLVTLAGSDLAVTVLRRWGWPAEAWYPLGAISALALLAWAGWRDYRLEEFRLRVPPSFPEVSAKAREWQIYREFQQEG